MFYYVTLDTNVLLSGILKPKSESGTLVLESLLGKIIPALDKKGKIIDDYYYVLCQPEFDLKPIMIEKLIIGIEKRALKIEQYNSSVICGDYNYFSGETDVKFYRVTLGKITKHNSEWGVYSNNNLVQRWFEKSPREMLRIIKSDIPERNLELMHTVSTSYFYDKFWEEKENYKGEG